MRFELDGADEQVLLNWRAALAAGADSWIPDALEEAFAGIDRPGKTIRIQRLEIDLGSLGDQPITPALLRERLAEKLAAQLASGLGTSEEDTGTVRVESDNHAIGEALAVFLRAGVLPWWSPAVSLDDLLAQALAVSSAQLRQIAAALAPVLREEQAAKRLLLQLPPETGASLAAQLPSGAGRSAAEWTGILTEARDGNATVLDQCVRRIRTAAGAPGSRPRPPSKETGVPERQAEAVIAGGDEASRTPPAGDDRQVIEDALAESFDSDVQAALAAPFAGLVLVAAFLPTLFQKLRLAEGKAFADTDAHTRAVQLTAYLADPVQERAEPDFLVAKLLCGWPLAEPLPRVTRLTGQDGREADELLTSVIAHWSALGHTSVDGLRETFLTRPGLLRARDEHWQLSVEQRGPDVLLGRLPWPLTPVRLPWMARAILVEWA